MVLVDIGKTELLTAINEWIIGEHAERDRAILYRRLIDGITYERLAEEFDLSVRHTKAIIHKRQRILSQHCNL